MNVTMNLLEMILRFRFRANRFCFDKNDADDYSQ